MTTLAQLVRTGVALPCMDQLLFLLPHPGGSASSPFTDLLFQCVPGRRRRFAGRYALEDICPRQGSGSGKRSWSIRHGTNPRSTQLREGSHSGSADHSAAPPYRPRSFFFSFGPCTARFLVFFWKKKRKWGVHCTSHRWYPFPPPEGQVKTSPKGGRKDPPCLILRSSSP